MKGFTMITEAQYDYWISLPHDEQGYFLSVTNNEDEAITLADEKSGAVRTVTFDFCKKCMDRDFHATPHDLDRKCGKSCDFCFGVPPVPTTGQKPVNVIFDHIYGYTSSTKPAQFDITPFQNGK